MRDLRLERFLENVRRALTSCLLGSLCLDCNLGSSIYCAGFDSIWPLAIAHLKSRDRSSLARCAVVGVSAAILSITFCINGGFQ